MASNPVVGFGAQIWPNIPKKVFDNISIAHPIFFEVYNNCKIEWESGTQYQPVVLFQSDTEGGQIDPNSTAVNLPMVQQQRTEGIVYNLRASFNPYSLTLAEKTQAGAGEMARITLMESKIIQATNRHVEIMSGELLQGNPATNGLDVWGLDQATSLNDVTPFVGQIDQSVDTWWAPQSITSSTVFDSVGQIITLKDSVTDGSDKPDKGYLGTTLYPRLLELMGQTSINIRTDNKETVYNIGNVTVEEVEFAKDKGMTSTYMYMLNTKYIEMFVSTMYDFWSSGFTIPFGGVYDAGFLLTSWGMAYTQRRRLASYTNMTL